MKGKLTLHDLNEKFDAFARAMEVEGLILSRRSTHPEWEGEYTNSYRPIDGKLKKITYTFELVRK